MKNNAQNAIGIVYPVFDSVILRRYLLVASIIIALLAFLFNGNTYTNVNQNLLTSRVYSFAMQVPAINAMASVSTFPVATAVAYLFSLCLGIVGVAAFLFAKIDVDTAMRAVRGRSSFVRVTIVILLLLLWGMQFGDQPTLQNFQVSYQFFESAKTHRSLLALWSEGIFLATFSIGAWVSIELSTLVNGLWRS
jgi:hypothetical protein